MSRTTSIRTVVLPTFGNQDIYAPAQAIYAAPSAYGAKDSQVLVPPGQVVFFSPELNTSISEATSKSTYNTVKIGVGVDIDGDGESEFIRWAGTFNKCSLLGQSAEQAACGVGTIADILFNSCALECGKGYGFQVQVHNAYTDAFDNPITGSVYDFVYTPPCPPCPTGECSGTTVSADEVMCGLYNIITQKRTDPNWNVKLNNFPIIVNEHDFLFDIAMLYDGADPTTDKTVYEFCFAEGDGTCQSCEYTTVEDTALPASVNSTDGSLDEEAIASYSTDLGDDANKITKAGFRKLAAEITRILDGKGKAVYLEPTGNCCPNHKIEVTTCLTDFELFDSEGDPITPCSTSNPFETGVTVYAECQDCDSSNSTNSYTAGLRLYAKTVKSKCDCIAGNNALVEYYPELEVFPAHGFVGGSGAIVLYKQNPTLPKNQGFQLQSLEIESLRENEGELFEYENWDGKYGVPSDRDILGHVLTNCKESYCVMSGTFRTPHTELPAGFQLNAQVAVHIYIPTGEDVAGDGIADAWNGIFAEDCGPVGVITCVD